MKIKMSSFRDGDHMNIVGLSTFVVVVVSGGGGGGPQFTWQTPAHFLNSLQLTAAHLNHHHHHFHHFISTST